MVDIAIVKHIETLGAYCKKIDLYIKKLKFPCAGPLWMDYGMDYRMDGRRLSLDGAIYRAP